VADLINREVECRFEGTGIAFGLGKQQAALQGGEGSQREPADIGVVMQLAPVSHAPEPVADRGFPAVEAAAAIVYLASPQAAFTHGVVLPVDGGRVAV